MSYCYSTMYVFILNQQIKEREKRQAAVITRSLVTRTWAAYENPSIICSRPSQKGSGSIPDLTSQSTLHAFLQRVNAM